MRKKAATTRNETLAGSESTGARMIPFTEASCSDEWQIRTITRAISAGDEQAFNGFYDRYAHRTYAYLLSVAHGNEQLARDAMQETMVRFIRYIKPHSDEDVFWRWLKRIGRTALFDLVRKKTTYAGHIAILQEDMEASGEHDNDRHENRWRAALDHALESVAHADRTLIEAFYFEGYSQRELAARYNTSRKAVESKLARIRMQLRGILTEALIS